MPTAVIVDAIRTPLGRRNGKLKDIHPVDLAAHVLRAVVERNGVDPELVEDVIMGCVMQVGEQGINIARNAALAAGFPETTVGTTVDRQCGSSQQAAHFAAQGVIAGAYDVVIAAGIESMSRVPMMGFNPLPNPLMASKAPAAYINMGETAENVAKKWDISRGEQEMFAVRSQQRAASAAAAGHFAAELVPITGKDGRVESDGCIRPGTTTAGLAQLKPAFVENGAVTAGTSSPLTDGASAVLICSEEYAMNCGLTPIARIRSVAVAGCAPEVMGIGPVAATRNALRRANLDIEDMDVVELNEAFASQALACVRDLGIRDEILNIDGGAIALGHPLGATGARIVGKAATLLHRVGGRYALSTQCIGGGQGIATVLERF